MRSRAAFEGEHRQVTVLFADLGGSFSLIYGLDSEEAQALLDTVLQTMIDAVHRYEGTVNQVLGDGIMALFGAPVAREDHAVRAASAARAMQDAMRRLPDRFFETRGARPQIRVGLNSGDVMIRNVRNDLSMDYRAVGSTTHMAARMEQLALPGTIRLTAETVRLGRGLLRVRALGPLDVRGVQEPVEVFELIGVATRTRFRAAIGSGLSPFTGRSQPLGLLRGVLERALKGCDQAVIVMGEPGIGKSRLCYELVASEQAREFRVLEAAALAYARSTPHALLVAILKSLIEVDEDDGPDQIRDKLAQRLGELAIAQDWPRTVALELLEVPSGNRDWQRLDPAQRRQQIDKTLRLLLTRCCEQGPLLLLLEDLHWGDQESLAFIAELLATPLGRPVVQLLTQRHDPALHWAARPHVTTCELDSLPRESCKQLLSALLGEDESLDDLCQRLTEHTGGNPFFIEEMVRAMHEAGVLEGERGNYRARLAQDDFLMPATIEALIAERLDRLAPAPLELLHAAAAIGDDSPVEVLRHVAGLAPERFDHQLQLLAAADLLNQTGSARAPVFRFRHALIRDVSYRRMVRARRKQLHARIVDAFEQLFPTRLGEHVERLATHSYRAELWQKAAEYHRLACTRASSRWANAQAIAQLDRGLETLAHIPEGPERDRLAIDLRLTALAPLVPVGDHERIIALLREAEAHALRLDDRTRLGRIYSQLGTALWLTASHDRALEVAEQARALSLELGDAPLTLSTTYSIAMIHHARGELGLALQMLRELAEGLVGKTARKRFGWAGYPSLFVRTFIISLDGLTGDFAEADAVYREGRALADELDHPYSTTMILEEYGFCLLVRGEHQAAREVLRHALEICEENQVVVMYTPIAARYGMALVECGQAHEGRRLLEHAMAHETYRTAGHYGLDYLLVGLSDAQLRTGDRSLALATARRGEQVTREVGEHAYHVCALVQLGNVLAALDAHRAEAFDVYRRAEDKARELGMVPFEALARQGRARLLLRNDDRTTAQRELEAALGLWRKLNAPARVAQIEALTAELTQPQASC